MLNKRKDLIELIEFGHDIKEIINLWDPLNLLYVAPEDEYETEIKGIRNLVVNNKNIDKKLLGQEIRKLFKYYFSNEYNSEKDIEENIASKIIECSKKYKLDFIVPNYYDVESIILDDKKMDFYIKLYMKIQKIINLWDPLKIRNISFNNEYSYEISMIRKRLLELENLTVQNMSEEINKIFKSSYNGIYETSKKIEDEIAEKILEEYSC